ncbi:MAG: hypothetical protein ACT4O0_05525 [Pseudonocardia sp.]
MIFTGRSGSVAPGTHGGYVAGRYRDGSLSDTWTDVARCARGTFVGYVPVCTCGWMGTFRPGTVDGFRASQRELVTAHLAGLTRPNRRPVST